MLTRSPRRYVAGRRAVPLAMVAAAIAWGGHVAGCGGTGTPSSSTGLGASRPSDATATSSVEPRPGVDATPAEASASPTAASGAPADARAPELVTNAPLLEPTTIVGAVYSKHMSEGLPPKLDATVTSARATPSREHIVEWDIGLRDSKGGEHHLYCFAPEALPVPVRAGESVRVLTMGHGGGPNRRYAIEIRAAAGTLLFAVNQPPDDWSVTRGASAGRTPMGGYDQQDYGVRFEHAGQRVEPASTSWARLTVGPRTYYVWGHAAERTLHPGKKPMPDYVGGWLDFAIVMAR